MKILRAWKAWFGFPYDTIKAEVLCDDGKVRTVKVSCYDDMVHPSEESDTLGTYARRIFRQVEYQISREEQRQRDREKRSMHRIVKGLEGREEKQDVQVIRWEGVHR